MSIKRLFDAVERRGDIGRRVAALVLPISNRPRVTLMAASISPARLAWASTASTMPSLRASSLRDGGEHIRRRIHVKRWSPFAVRIPFYRVVMAINPGVIARAGVLPRQAKSCRVVVVNRDLDIGEGADGHDAIFSSTRLALRPMSYGPCAPRCGLSLCPLCGACYSAPNICSSQPWWHRAAIK